MQKKFKEMVSQVLDMVVLGVNNPSKKKILKVGYLESRVKDFANIVSRLLKGVMRSATP